jgi:Na+/H+ antiporter NhaD/arsenite permease-like protein
MVKRASCAPVGEFSACLGPKVASFLSHRALAGLSWSETPARLNDIACMHFPNLLANATGAAGVDIPLWLIAPFALLLLLIATLPLTPHRIKHLWERSYPFVSIALGAAVGAYYMLNIPGGGTVLQHTMVEYVSFIALIGSLFVVAGGIHVNVKGNASPLENVVFLAVGAILANAVGTTGASMVMIRPWIRMNRVRIGAYHIVFFIFLISNVGGAITPIGDPPLFLGYLRGVPFFWLVDHVIGIWLLTVGALLAVFFVFDLRGFHRIPHRAQTQADRADTWRFDGIINVLFLLVVIGAVFLPANYFVREAVMLGAAFASYRWTPKGVHAKNEFSFGPIKEVAFLFVGIFATMMPALGYLEQHGREFGFTRPTQYYFASGSLSAVLDNAPTYVNFLQLAQTTAEADSPAAFAAAKGDSVAAVRVLLAERPLFVVAVSLGAVFFGAMTYIGNGPNFMVKSIAESSGVPVPSFFGYVFKYSLPILLPILTAVGLLFL